MSAELWFANLRSDNRENLFDKLQRLLDVAGLSKIVGKGDPTAIKMHFGEKGGHAYIRPVFIRKIVVQIKKAGGKPFLTDSSTLYPGERKEAISALNCGVHPLIDWEITLEHAEKVGLGSTQYTLLKLEPEGEGW